MPLSTSLRNSFRKKSKNSPPSKTPEEVEDAGAGEECKGDNPDQGNKKMAVSQSRAETSSLFERMALWSSKVEAHNAKQASNPFSDKYKGPQKLDKNDPNYGRPDENSLTAKRARDGEAKLRQEVCDLCKVIFDMGDKMTMDKNWVCEEGKARIKFGKLFQIYNGINDKVVGLLLRARKKMLLTFEGEMLFQRRDDDKWITLLKTINTIYYYFGRDADLPGGGPVDNEDPDIRAITEERNNNKENNIEAAEPAESVTEENNGVVTIKLATPPPARRKKSSVIQQIRKFSTRKRSQLKPVPAAVEVEENTESSERPERKKSAVATLFVNLARTPSRAARSFRKRSKAATATGTPALPTKAGEEAEVKPATGQRTAVQRWRLVCNVARVIGSVAAVRKRQSDTTED